MEVSLNKVNLKTELSEYHVNMWISNALLHFQRNFAAKPIVRSRISEGNFESMVFFKSNFVC